MSAESVVALADFVVPRRSFLRGKVTLRNNLSQRKMIIMLLFHVAMSLKSQSFPGSFAGMLQFQGVYKLNSAQLMPACLQRILGDNASLSCYVFYFCYSGLLYFILIITSRPRSNFAFESRQIQSTGFHKNCAPFVWQM